MKPRIRVRKDIIGFALAKNDEYLVLKDPKNESSDLSYYSLYKEYGFIILFLVFEIYIPLKREKRN